MNRYVAFLRGINVGGHKKVKMDDLRRTFESLRLKDVKTFLVSGNVRFEAEESNQLKLKDTIEEKLKKVFGFEVNVMIRKFDHIRKWVDSNPFQKIRMTPDTRLYVTFLSEKLKSGMGAPYESPEKDFQILKVTKTEVFSVVYLSPHRRTVDVMSILEKRFGSNITTRNWNTVIKVLKD